MPDRDLAEQVRELARIQCSKGNWDQGDYMRGMANAMLVAVSVLNDTPADENTPFFEVLGKNAADATDIAQAFIDRKR